MKTFAVSLVILLAIGTGCSSSQKVGRQSYAELKTEQTFEESFEMVWSAVEVALKDHRVIERDPEEVDVNELKKLDERSLRTDWIYARSNDKFVTYKINDLPKKKYLQTRFRYKLEVERVMGGTLVRVLTDEEVETLDDKGEATGYDEVETIDSSRPNRLLKDIKNALLSAPVL